MAAPRKARPRPAPTRDEVVTSLPFSGPWGGVIFASISVLLLFGGGWIVWRASIGRPVWPW